MDSILLTRERMLRRKQQFMAWQERVNSVVYSVCDRTFETYAGAQAFAQQHSVPEEEIDVSSCDTHSPASGPPDATAESAPPRARPPQ